MPDHDIDPDGLCGDPVPYALRATGSGLIVRDKIRHFHEHSLAVRESHRETLRDFIVILSRYIVILSVNADRENFIPQKHANFLLGCIVHSLYMYAFLTVQVNPS